jgi:basic membrane lipoprotein Med (substrate-binding protein (PBP1-ABC) superfamily)
MLNRRSLLLIPLAAVPAVVLTGCGGGDDSASNSGASPNSEDGKRFKVGLITNGSLTDSGWNSLAGQGLQDIKNEFGAETGHQSTAPEAGEEALRAFARDSFRLVFAHGSEFGDAAKNVAAENPNTIFVVSSGEVKGPNLASLRFDLGEAAYLAGMFAASFSKTGKAGQIGGQDFPPVKAAFELFEKGAQAVNPKFKTTITYLNSWSDAGAAKERALAMIRNGADIIFQNCDAAAEGIFQAAEEMRAKGVKVVGSNANQNDLKPNFIIASAVLDVAKTFMSVARDVREGKFKGDIYLEDLKSGNVAMVPNPVVAHFVPDDLRAKMQKAEADIISGKLKLIKK